MIKQYIFNESVNKKSIYFNKVLYFSSIWITTSSVNFAFETCFIFLF